MKYPTNVTTKENAVQMCTWNVNKEKDAIGPFKVLEVRGSANPEIYILYAQKQDGEKVMISHRPRDMTAVRHEFGVDTDVENWGWIDLEQITGTNRYRVIPAIDQIVEEEAIGR